MLISIQPKYSVAQVLGNIKGKSAFPTPNSSPALRPINLTTAMKIDWCFENKG